MEKCQDIAKGFRVLMTVNVERLNIGEKLMDDRAYGAKFMPQYQLSLLYVVIKSPQRRDWWQCPFSEVCALR